MQRLTEFIGPRNELEAKLQHIWSRLLRVYPIGITDDFFDIGGDSLSAMRLITDIANIMRRNVGPTFLFRNPTIAQMSCALESEATEYEDLPLIALRLSAESRPFFCVHALDSGLLDFVSLCQHIGPDHTFYGLQSSLFFGDGSKSFSIENLASYYLEALRAVQPEGPYMLGGWCTGGIVAFEMAQQLDRQGQRVALLALIDIGAPPFDESVALSLKQDIIQDLGYIALGLRGRNPSRAAVSREDLQRIDIDDKLQSVLDAAGLNDPALPAGALQEGLRRARVLMMRDHALLAYQPREYSQRITLFLADEDADKENGDLTLGWRKLCRLPIQIVMVPGTHMSMVVGEHAYELAIRLRKCMDDASVEDKG